MRLVAPLKFSPLAPRLRTAKLWWINMYHQMESVRMCLTRTMHHLVVQNGVLKKLVQVKVVGHSTKVTTNVVVAGVSKTIRKL